MRQFKNPEPSADNLCLQWISISLALSRFHTAVGMLNEASTMDVLYMFREPRSQFQ
jgi:hypothetical protein